MKEKIYTIPVNDAFDKDCECPLCAMYQELENNAVEYTMAVGVLLTALFTGTFIYFLFQWLDMGIKLTFLQSLLFASVMSSTDSASVFSILRSKKTNLKQNLKPLLEFESGSNDPMAYMLTMVLIQMISQGDSVTIWDGVLMFVVQFSLGLRLRTRERCHLAGQ